MSYVGDKEDGIGFEVETVRYSPPQLCRPKHMWMPMMAGKPCVKFEYDETQHCTSCWAPHGEVHHKGCSQNPERVVPLEAFEDIIEPVLVVS